MLALAVVAQGAAGKPGRRDKHADLERAALPAIAPSLVAVPEALLQRTSMPELSAIAWSGPLGRYLVVSDDTGDKRLGTAHAPWLFTLSREGALDSEPLVIADVDSLNDAEALCAGPGGTFLLSTSHSKTKKGKDKAERQRLLVLRAPGPGARTLQVEASVDLTALLADAQVAPEGQVDIEAMAYREDALYLGLKAPLTAQGAAQIVRVRPFAAALQRGSVAPQEIARVAALPLQVAALAGGGQVVQGISDMSFLPDGSLALLANSPKHLPPDGGGALWWLGAEALRATAAPRAPGAGAPRLVRRFPGLKPEGVTLSPEGDALIIVFDRDRQQPLWLRLPLPR